MHVLTYNPNAHVETTSVDGDIEYNTGDTTTWASIRAKTSGSNADPTGAQMDLGIRRDGANNWVDTRRCMALFDISAFPLGSVKGISSITLQLYVNNFNINNFADSVTICEALPASNTDLVVGDFNIATKFGSTRLATDILITNMTIPAYNTWTLNAAGITYIKTRLGIDGIVKFGILSKADFDNAEPAGTGDGRTLGGFSTADGANTPILTINYVKGGLLLMGVGS